MTTRIPSVFLHMPFFKSYREKWVKVWNNEKNSVRNNLFLYVITNHIAPALTFFPLFFSFDFFSHSSCYFAATSSKVPFFSYKVPIRKKHWYIFLLYRMDEKKNNGKKFLFFAHAKYFKANAVYSYHHSYLIYWFFRTILKKPTRAKRV